MADKTLVSYIRNSLARGGEPNTIKIALLRSGYQNEKIEEAFREAQHLEIHHTIHFSPALLALIVAIVIGAAGFGYFVLQNSPNEKDSKLLDITMESIQGEAFPGEDLVVLKEVTNMGSAKGYDVELKTELINPRSGKVIATKTETRAIETIGSTQTRIEVPSSAVPGEYIIRTIAEYDSKKAVASVHVAILEKQKVQQGGERENEAGGEVLGEDKSRKTATDCDDNDPCTSNALVGGECVFDPIVPCCNDGRCEEGEKCAQDCRSIPEVKVQGVKETASIEEIAYLATTNPPKAMQQCAAQDISDYRDSCFVAVAKVAKDQSHCQPIINERLKDVCFSEVAKVSQNSATCENVAKEDRRDSCYIAFVIDNSDFSVCEKIVGENLRQSCFAYRDIMK